jgi:hypothetical protein
MKTLRILIVERTVGRDGSGNNGAEIITAAVVVEASVAAAKKVLHDPRLCFLDVDVTNGKTFKVSEFSNASVCLLFLFRGHHKNSCLLTCHRTLHS